MARNAVFEFVEPWQNGRCRVSVGGAEHDVVHVHMPCYSKPWFRSGDVVRQRFTALLRALEAGKRR